MNSTLLPALRTRPLLAGLLGERAWPPSWDTIGRRGTRNARTADADADALHLFRLGLTYPLGRQFGPVMLPDEELYPQAGAGFPAPAQAAFERVDMALGSVLFLPRGTWHRSEALEDSFSLSIGTRALAALDCVLAQLRSLLLQDSALSSGPTRCWPACRR